MPKDLGKRVAYQRRIARMTQQELADAAGVHVGTLRKIERGARGAGDNVMESLAAALGVEPSVLLGSRDRADARVHAAMPSLSAVIAAYEGPDDGPVRQLGELRAAVDESVTWRLASQYARIARQLPPTHQRANPRLPPCSGRSAIRGGQPASCRAANG